MNLLCASDYVIVFVHLGPSLPAYTPLSLSQARLFNPDCPIYLVANQEALENFSDNTVITIPCESLAKSGPHEKFLLEGKTNGFWQYVVERFYYLEELMSQHQLKNVFHLENDVMLYRDLKELLPTFEKNYSGMMAGTFDNDSRCVAGFLYVSEIRPLSEFVKFTTSKLYTGENDMHLLGQFREAFYKKYIDHLPIINPLYASQNPLESYTGKRAQYPSDYTNHFDEFLSIFDAAALGQFLGGLDPIHLEHDAGFINESCVFNPAYLDLAWQRDAQGRQVPVASYKGISHPINNLHIHCKNLALFSSLRDEVNPTAESPPEPEKITYALPKDPIDVVIYATEKNKMILDSCIDSLRTYGKDISRIVVVSEMPLTEKGEWFDEKNFPFNKESILNELFPTNPYEKIRYRYHPRNQLASLLSRLIRLYAPIIIPNLSPNLLILEPDIIFVSPIAFANEEGEPLFSPRGTKVKAFNNYAFQLLPDFIYGHFRDFDHFALVQKPIHDELFQRLTEKHQKEPWRAICNKLETKNPYEPCFSDFALYGNFALLRTEQAKIKPQKWAPASDLYYLSKYQKEGCIYVRYQMLGTRD
jgi:hypothetical protein